jgi:hypothetical protein
MRRSAVMLVLAVLIVLIAAPSQAGDKSPFVGHWEGINEVLEFPGLGDDSRMIINISEGRDGFVNVFFKDFGATACGTDPGTGEPLYAGQSKSLGVIEDDVLSTYGRGGKGVGNGALWCMAKPPFVLFEAGEEPTPFVTYEAAEDRLFDGYDYYYRAGKS